MSKHNRRAFLQTSTCALAAGLSPVRSTLSRGAASDAAGPALGPAPVAQAVAAVDRSAVTHTNEGKDPDAAMGKVHDLGLPTCQVFADVIEAELAGRLRQALDKYGIEATSLVVG